MVKRSSSGPAADSRTVARECEAADIIAQRAGRGDQGRTADGITRAEARYRSHRLHDRRVPHLGGVKDPCKRAQTHFPGPGQFDATQRKRQPWCRGCWPLSAPWRVYGWAPASRTRPTVTGGGCCRALNFVSSRCVPALRSTAVVVLFARAPTRRASWVTGACCGCPFLGGTFVGANF